MPRRTTTLVAVGLLALLLGAAPAAAGIREAGASLDRALREVVATPYGPPGAIAMIQRGKQREVHRAGISNIELGGRLGPRQSMRLASVSKAFSGAVALELVERGRLGLDQSIRSVLPWLPAEWQATTLRQALQHTSGLPEYIADPDFIQAFGANPKGHLSPVQLIGFVADEPLDFPAGSQYHYSDTDNIVVGLMAQAATGQSYETLLKRLVYRPLKLRRTIMPPGFTLPQPFIHGYDFDGPGLPLEDLSEALSASGAWASGGIVSTAADLNTFIRAYAGKRLLGKGVRREQRRFYLGGASDPPGPGFNSAGLAIFRYQTSCGTVLGHTGSFPGYTQFAAATSNGRRSTTVSINLQATQKSGPPGVYDALVRARDAAVCAALAGKVTK
ncbi:MAG: serine hydrolase domain-containing protein [Solirubrobacterales bacterium]